MPEDDFFWNPREEILTFEEIDTLVEIFLPLGDPKAALDRR